MNRQNWYSAVIFSLCLLMLGCNTTSNVRITDTVRKVITYETDKKVRVVGEKIEMEDPINFGQWWEAKKISGNTYAFTDSGMKNKKMFEDQQLSADDGGGDGGGY
jgi:hypothetical protein